MVDKLESGQDAEKTAEQLIPQFEGDGDKQPLVSDVDAIATALQGKLAKWLDEEVDKRLQSQKDRRFSKLERQYDDVDARLARFAQLLESGLKPDQAKNQLDLEEAIEFVRQQRQGKAGDASADQSVPSSADHTQAIADANSLLKEVGLDNDPAWIETLRATKFKSGADLMKTAYNFAIKRVTQKPETNEALAIQSGGTGGDRPDLEAAYKKEMLAARGQGNAVGKAIKAKYRQKGLENVDSISLTS